MSHALDLTSIHAARRRIAGHVRRTPVLPLPSSIEPLVPGLRLKLENLQVTGSFKPRGVFNTLLQLDEGQRQRGVCAASGGNHGVALAYAAARLGLAASVYLPASASDDRMARVAQWGATVVRHGSAWDDAHARAVADAAASGSVYVHPFDAQETLAGQATLGLELLDDLPDLDCLVIAVGGGGLLAGVAAAVKQTRPHVRIVGVEPVGADSLARSLAAGQVVPLSATHTIADTLAPRSTSPRVLDLARRFVDEVVRVPDAAMVQAMRWLWRECNQLVEPAGAASIAALMTDPTITRDARQPVAIICGGNAAVEGVFQNYGG